MGFLRTAGGGVILVLGVAAAAVAATLFEPTMAGARPAPVDLSALPSADEAPDGVVLVDVETTVVDPAGDSVTTVHRALRPDTRRGALRVEKIVYPYRSRSENARVVQAHRITVDGRDLALPPAAVLVETPQPLAEQHCYTDITQLVLLFPGTAPGDTVEYTIEKRTSPVAPGVLSTFMPVADLWPIASARRELVVPPGWASRLSSRALGLPGVEARRESQPDGSTALRWELTGAPALRMEAGRQPIRQGGPGIWVSTIPSWAEVARWYTDLVSGCEALGPELEQLVDEWAGDLENEDELVQVLHQHLAGHVSFLGLESGLSSFCPRPAADVWRSGFGDCKETAALLRSMLARVGITSHLVLVNTRHAGRIERSVPSFQQFNHVILAVLRRDGSLLFCDPSVSGLPPGELSPGVGGRTALLVAGYDGQLIELPQAPAGRLALELDLEVLPAGQLHGRIHLEADAYQGTMAVAHLLEPDVSGPAAGVRRMLAEALRDPEILEIRREPTPTGASSAAADLFVRASTGTEGTRTALRVPIAAALVPRPGSDERRETPFFQPLGTTSLTATFRFPSGWSLAGELPQDLAVDTGCRAIHAQWRATDTGLTVRVRHETTRSVVEPAAWVSCVRALASLWSWLGDRVLVDIPTGAGGDSSEARLLPRLPGGRAQLDLVDAMFPRDEDPARRRAALVQVEEWFADDPATAFEAGLERAVLDQEEGHPERTVALVRDLIHRHGDAVGPELRGWAEYLLAGGLHGCGDHDAARTLYDRLCHAGDLSAARRGWACARAADLRLESEPATALAILEAAVREESPALEQQVALLARLAIAGVPGADLERALDEVSARFPSRALDVHARLVWEVRRQLDTGRFAAAATLLAILERRVAPGSPMRALEPQVRATRVMLARGLRCRDVARAIANHLETAPPAWWSGVPPPADSRDRVVATLQRLDHEPGSLAFVRGGLELLAHVDVAPDFFTFLLRRCADHLRFRGGDTELVDQLERWWAQLEEENPGSKEAVR